MPSSLFQASARAAAPAMASNAIGMNPQIMQAAQSAKRMIGMLRAAKNPQSALQMVAQQNPQFGALMQMCNGKNPQAVFEDQCRQHGIDPNQAMQQIQSMIGS